MTQEEDQSTETTTRLSQAEIALGRLLNREMGEIIKILSMTKTEGTSNPYLISIPVSEDVDLTMEEILSLVARTSNAYSRLSRLTGMAKANAKIAKGRYDRAHKSNRRGKNEAEREKNAIEASAAEHQQLVMAEALVDLANGYENAARLASESIRKIATSVQHMNIADGRQERGSFQDRDFS